MSLHLGLIVCEQNSCARSEFCANPISPEIVSEDSVPEFLLLKVD